MEQFDIELMTNSKLSQIKAGRWYYIDGRWWWYPDDDTE